MKQKKVLEQSLCGVLALLGFAACAETSVEYGTPTMDFWVRGKVISDDGGNSFGYDWNGYALRRAAV